MTTTTVQTTYGDLAGTTDPDGVHVFKGVPFAAPPVGDLRFRAPQPPEAWSGTRDATEFGPIAPQPAAAGGVAMVDPQPQSEDCLFLNVWTPDLGGSRPVMVWIHGGAFQSGSGSTPLYRANNLVTRGDVVVVTINYRLGVLGWLASDELGGGNWGLLDQVAALEWVRDNIAAFGGDAGNVTIFGESAGSVSVSTLVGTPAAKGLFHRAIAQSGGPGGWDLARAERFAAKLATEAGAGSVAGLRDLPLDDLLAAQERAVLAAGGRLSTPMAPVVDGVSLVRSPIDEIRDGLNAGVPLIAGTNRDEMTYFALGNRRLTGGDEDVVQRALARTVGDDAREVMERYAKLRADRGDTAGPFDLWVAIESDRMFRIPSLRMAEAHAATGSPTYDYLFDWESPAAGGFLKSCHALDLPFVFGNYQGAMARFAGEGPEVAALSSTMMDAWLAFAKTGDPSTPAAPWPRYDGETRATLRLGRVVEVLDAPFDAERRVWDGRPTGRMSKV